MGTGYNIEFLLPILQVTLLLVVFDQEIKLTTSQDVSTENNMKEFSIRNRWWNNVLQIGTFILHKAGLTKEPLITHLRFGKLVGFLQHILQIEITFYSKTSRGFYFSSFNFRALDRKNII